MANPKEVLAALTDARPTFFVGVPAIWYKIKAGVEAKLAAEKSPVKKRLGAWAIGVGRRVVRLEGSRSRSRCGSGTGSPTGWCFPGSVPRSGWTR